MPHIETLHPSLGESLGGWRTRPPRLLLLAALGAGSLAIGQACAFASTHALLINASPSLPNWAIWLDRSAVPGRGDLAVFMPPRSELVRRHFGENPAPFGKRVIGVAGDVVTERGRVFYVNGTFAARAKTTSRLGEPLALGPTGTIPHGCYFVATDHKDSLDSRYAAIGWVCRAQVLGRGSAIL